MNKLNNLPAQNESFVYAPRKNNPYDESGAIGLMYEKKVKNPDGSITTKLKNFSSNSAGFHTKALLSGYSRLTKETAMAYIKSKGLSEKGANIVFQKITAFKHIGAQFFESQINDQKNEEIKSNVAEIEKLAKSISS